MKNVIEDLWGEGNFAIYEIGFAQTNEQNDTKQQYRIMLTASVSSNDKTLITSLVIQRNG